ncbi:MAG TPA: MaoC/PaaZ C-terminal domain-containing protein [Reyranella sp.]
MTRRSFAQEEVDRFGWLSGDVNPIHVDPVAARRMIFNRPVVHGIMLIGWVLECQMGQLARSGARLRTMTALFIGPVPVGDEVTLETDGAWPALRFRIICGGAVVARGSIGFEESSAADAIPVGQLAAPRGPAELDRSAFASAKGEERLEIGSGFEILFPALAARLPHWQIAVLTALTRIVGMHCPGLNSILSEIDIRFEAQPAPTIGWKVGEFDDRFGRLSLDLVSTSVTGTVIAFERPVAGGARPQAGILSSIGPREFAHFKPLIVGATRGMGGVLTRLLVAGGARVVGTFNMGSADAATLVEELKSGPGQCRFEKLDIFDRDTTNIRRIIAGSAGFSHLFYTATPPIFVGTSGVVSNDLFEHFLEAYVGSFLRLFETLEAGGPTLAGVFFPSSAAVQDHQPGLAEYAMAKAAAEAMIAALAARHRKIQFLAPRLPRLDTDQTINRAGVAADDPAPLALALLRQFRS